MLSRAELNERESDNQTARPDSEQGNHRQRAEVAQDGFPSALRFDAAGQLRYGYPCERIEPAGDAEMLAPYAPRQNDGLESVEKDANNDESSGDDGGNVHC